MEPAEAAAGAPDPVIPAPPSSPPPGVPPPSVAPAEAPPAPVAAPRGGGLLRLAALLLAVIVVLAGFVVLYADDQGWQRRAHNLERQNASLHSQLLTSQTSLSDAQSQISTLQAEAAHPHVGIWNVAQTIQGSNWYLAGGVPDTFTYHLDVQSTGPMSVSILTFEQFGAAIECIDNGAGAANYCLHHSSRGTVKSWLAVTSVSYDFHLAEGCADYMVVFTSAAAITVMPNVSVTYNPAPTFTGDCAPH